MVLHGPHLLLYTVAVHSWQVQLLGFSWASADESKMQSTFGVGNKSFGSFVDLQQVAQGLGYINFGLSRLALQVRTSGDTSAHCTGRHSIIIAAGLCYPVVILAACSNARIGCYCWLQGRVCLLDASDMAV